MPANGRWDLIRHLKVKTLLSILWNMHLWSTATFLLRMPLVIPSCRHYCLFCEELTAEAILTGFVRSKFFFFVSFIASRFRIIAMFITVDLTSVIVLCIVWACLWRIPVPNCSGGHFNPTARIFTYSFHICMIHSCTWRFHYLRTIFTVLTTVLLESQIICDFFDFTTIFRNVGNYLLVDMN